MSKWLKFKGRFNFTPKKKAAVTLQYNAGDIEQVTDEAAEKALGANLADEIEAPANADALAKMRAGELEPKLVEAPKAKAEGTSTPPAETGGQSGKSAAGKS